MKPRPVLLSKDRSDDQKLFCGHFGDAVCPMNYFCQKDEVEAWAFVVARAYTLVPNDWTSPLVSANRERKPLESNIR